MQKILTWATLSGAAAFFLILAWSGGQSLAVRITTSLLVSGGGFVAGGLVALVFLGDDEHEESHSGT